MKLRIAGLVIAALFCAHNAFSQLQVNKIKYQGLALWDSIPTFPGGDTALASYWNVDLKLPNADTACKAHGTVYVKFWVESTGHIMEIISVEAKSDIYKDTPIDYIDNCIKPTEQAIIDKATTLAQTMPRWNSTISKNGMPKRCRVTLPIRY
jgi:hypothetical protein